MKLLFGFIALLMLNKECDQKQTDIQNIDNEEVKIDQKETLQFSYKVLSRGFFEMIWVTKETVSISKDRNLIEVSRYDCPNEDWDELLALLKDISIENLPNLEAPTKKHQFDGAAMATLKMSVDGVDYETPIFDNGIPPKAIEAIVNKLLSIKSAVEKP